jgi:hypothetical protein
MVVNFYKISQSRNLGPRQKNNSTLACLMVRLLRYIHPHVSRYAQVDVPFRQTIIQRIRVELFLTVTLCPTSQPAQCAATGGKIDVSIVTI